MKNQTMKMHQILKEEYDIWAMEMEHYLEYIDNEVWKVIQNGNSKKRISTGKDGIVRVLSPVSAAEIQAVEKERKAKNILLMAIPKEHMRRFHGMDDAKEIWEAIRTRFGGNANSKKMQKVVFKQQFEAFKISNSERLEKGYDRFQQLLSQLEAHGAEVSTKDANHKWVLLTMDDGVVKLRRNNTEAEETNNALMVSAQAMRNNAEISVDSWKDSSKNLWRLFNLGMLFNDKLGLEDSIGKPSYSRFTKTNDFKGVPPPLSGDYTPKPQEEIDDSLPELGIIRVAWLRLLHQVNLDCETCALREKAPLGLPWDCLPRLDSGVRNCFDAESHLVFETSGHGATKENHLLNDGAYLMVTDINKKDKNEAKTTKPSKRMKIA
ncbi:hypothetical protein Tco_0045354 [Tanacetum coccineum]